MIDAARGLEGLRRQDSIHAAGVVISPVPMTELVPIQRKGEGAEVVTQYEMGAVEQLGLLKMDFLGLRNLSTIDGPWTWWRRPQETAPISTGPPWMTRRPSNCLGQPRRLASSNWRETR